MERSKVIRWIMFAISLGLLVVGALFYHKIISYLLVGFTISYILFPIVHYAERYGIPRVWGIMIVYLVIGGLLTVFFNVVIPQLIDQVISFTDIFRDVYQNPEALSLESIGLGKVAEFFTNIESSFPGLELESQIYDFFSEDKINGVLNQFPMFFKSIANIVAFLIVVPFIVFFMLKDERQFRKAGFNGISNRYFEFSMHLFEKIEESFGKYFRALLLETFLVALLSIIGLLILGIPNAILLGIIVGLSNPIKYFGPFIGAIPTLLVILLGPTANVYIIYSIIMYFIVQQIDSMILFPVLVGKSMDMHPMVVLLTVIAGGYTFGVLGMLLGVPVVFIVKTMVQVSHKSLKEFEII